MELKILLRITILTFLPVFLYGTADDARHAPDSIQTIKDDPALEIIEFLVEHYPDSALKVFPGLEAEALTTNNREMLSKIYTLQARANYFKGNYHAGLEYGEKAAGLYSKLKNPEKYYQILIQLGALNIHSGNLYLAKNYLIMALTFFEDSKDTLNMLRCYVNLSGIHILLDNTGIAQRYVDRVIVLSERPGLEIALAKGLNNAGIIHFLEGRPDMAEITFLTALETAVYAGEAQSYLDCLNYLGIIEIQRSNYQKALEYYKKMTDYSGNYIDLFVLSNGMINKARAFEKLGNLPEAVRWTRKSINISSSSGDFGNLRDGYRQMANYMSKMGRMGEAYEYMQEYTIINDSLLTASKTRSILELEAIYESEQKEQQIKNLELLNTMNEDRIRTIARISLLSGSLLLVSGLFVLGLIRNRQRRKQLVNLEVEHQLLRSQMNPHFLFNSLTAVQNYILGADSITAAGYLAKFTRLMRLILMNSREKFISLDNEMETVKNYLELSNLRFPDRFIWKLTVPPDLNTEDIMVPPMMAQPFIENAVEHGFPADDKGNYINVCFILNGGNVIEVIVEDNGIGRSSSDANRNRSYQSLATEITCNRIAALQKMGYRQAGLHIEDKTGPSGRSEGTKIILYLPVTYKSV